MVSSVSSIAEITSELAAQNPSASSEYITEIIVSSIESEPIISDAISHIQIPTISNIKQYEFMSKSLPRDKRKRILERIGNANFFRKLQYIYTLPIQGSDLRPIIHRDGARVDLALLPEYSDRAYQKLSESQHPTIDETYENIPTTEDVHVDHSHSVLTQKIPARNTKQVKTSSSHILREIDEESVSNQPLSLYKIYQIIRVTESLHEQDTMFGRISTIVSNDIKVRNRIFKTSCIDELYRDEEILPEEIRVHHPSSLNIVDKIYENLRAIIVHEYKRLHNQYGQQFIDGQITYDMYVQKTDRYAMYADRLTSELP
jgi:hypothetical protein